MLTISGLSMADSAKSLNLTWQRVSWAWRSCCLRPVALGRGSHGGCPGEGQRLDEQGG